MDYSEPRFERQNFLQRMFRNKTAHIIGEVYTEISGLFSRHGRQGISQHILQIPHLPSAFEGYRIVHLTDAHIGRSMCGSRLQRVIEEINQLKPDVVLSTGDFLSWGTRYIQTAAEGLAQIKAPDGIYSVLGNHDYFIDAGRIVESFKKIGVKWLTNKNAQVRRGDESIVIIGLDDHQLGRPNIQSAVSGVPSQAVKILLAHNPVSIEEDTAGYTFDLVLSGHTHGGQILVPKFGAPIMPGRRTRPYRAGWFTKNGSRMYVSRGTGLSSMLPIRINCPPELALFILKRG